ncbi:Na/Pi symporter [Pontibacillus salicampi]|uniref:Na/Pi symporter n=1 Tax=Pontibacillus salicampi TaxID=1449801 RepID=A0ABV6LJI6_9BACI
MGDVLTLFVVFLSMFLFGMAILRIGLYQLSYQNMRKLLARFADNPVKGMLAGLLMTAVLQSSSCTMVLTVGLVAVGVLNFKQSIGVILGANIGTTVTVELLSLQHSIPLWPMLIIGAVLLLSKKQSTFGIGSLLFGLGTIFVALHGFSTLAEPLQRFPIVQESLTATNSYPVLSIVVGAVVTSIIQSSTAATGIAMAFLQEGLFTMPSAIGIMLGANVGTCITAWIASIGTNTEAKLVAMGHIWLNIFGVVLFAPFLQELSAFSVLLAHTVSQQLAHISVLFNVLSSLILLPFITPFSKMIIYLHGKKRTP